MLVRAAVPPKPNSLRRLWQATRRCHSASAPSMPRNNSALPPWQVSIWPKTGSTIALRRA